MKQRASLYTRGVIGPVVACAVPVVLMFILAQCCGPLYAQEETKEQKYIVCQVTNTEGLVTFEVLDSNTCLQRKKDLDSAYKEAMDRYNKQKKDMIDVTVGPGTVTYSVKQGVEPPRKPVKPSVRRIKVVASMEEANKIVADARVKYQKKQEKENSKKAENK